MPKALKRRSLTVDGFLDIETEDWSLFLCGTLVRTTGEVEVFDFRREYDYVVEILRQPGVYWTWNGGRFDTLWFLQWMVHLGVKARAWAAGQSITCLELPEFGVEIRDAARLVPMKLSKAADICGLKKMATGLECNCGHACGGYCQFKRGMPAHLLERVRDYMVVDAEVGLAVLDVLSVYAGETDLDLCGTIGASAWSTARRWLGLEKAAWKHSGTYDFARGGYYGGRVNVFRSHAEAGHQYDINAAYPAALAVTRLPVGTARDGGGPASRDAFRTGKEGIYQATVRGRETFVPPLPVRLPDRIAYPIGVYTGIWTRIELQNALDAGGVEIVEWGRSLYWESSEPILETFARRVWELRRGALEKNSLGKKGGLPSFLKLFANSATGKLAQRPETDRIVINPKPEEVKLCPADFDCAGGLLHTLRRCCPHRCYVDKCGGSKPLDMDMVDMRIWSTPVYRIPECGHVEWAAYLTAATRVELWRQLRADGHDGFLSVYCDTDSCFTLAARERRVGAELGEWEYLGPFREFRARAPKVYGYYDGKGIFQAKAKGIPRAEKVWAKILSGEEIRMDRGVETFRTAARMGTLFTRKFGHRRIAKAAYGDRELRGEITYPKEVDIVTGQKQ